MRSRKQTTPERNGDHLDDPSKAETTSAADALALADEAEAEAAEAEAVAAAARARARALRLRREAEAAKTAETDLAADDVADATKTVADDSATAPVTPDDIATEDAEDETGAVDETVVDEPELDTKKADKSKEEAADEAPAKKRRRLRVPMPSWRAVGATVTIILIGALLAGCGYMFWFHRQAQDEQKRRAEFNAAARQGVVTLMSLDFTHAKEDVQRIIDNSTGQFKEDFQNTAEDFVKVAVDSKAVTETTVTGSAVESMTDDAATVIVAASSKVTNAAGAKQEPRSWRLSVNMQRDGGQLKMSKVEFVP